MFDEAKNLTADITDLKAKVAARIAKSQAKLANIYTDFDARVTTAEASIQQNLDAQALEVEAVVKDLTNAGEQVAAVSGNGSAAPVTQKVAL